MGSEHMISNESLVRDRLMQEFAHLGPGRDEVLVDAISPDGQIVRVHLRPFTLLQFQKELLLQAFIRTAKEIPPSTERLAEYVAVAIQLDEEGMLPFSGGLVTKYLAKMRASGFPAVHHSVKYEQLYQPAYRVVSRDLLPKEIVAAT
jgi:hypothetical protein